MAKRIQWLDIVKGVAILGVVLQHTFQRLMTYYNLDDDIVLNFLNKLIVSCNMELNSRFSPEYNPTECNNIKIFRYTT